MLKKYFLFVFIFFAGIAAQAQVDLNYTQYAVGGGISYIRGYTNLNIQENHIAANLNFTYYYTGYIPITAEIQAGTLSGGSIILDPSKRAYTNNYIALIFHGDFQLGQVIDQDNFFRDFYGGTGFGFISNNDKVQREDLNNVGHVFPGKDKSIGLMVPLRIGYEYKFFNEFQEPFLRVSISYEHNIVFGEGLDGYNDPPSQFKNNASDQYRQITIGVKYDFGTRQ